MSYDDLKGKPGRQHIWLAELYLDYCQLSYGEGACPAVLGVDSETKCFNTEATCAAPEAYDPELKMYRFVEARDNTPIGIGAVPSLLGVTMTPGQIEIGGGLGSRSVVTLTFQDHPGSDINIDKYVLEKGIDQSIDSIATYGPAMDGPGFFAGDHEWVTGLVRKAAVRFDGTSPGAFFPFPVAQDSQELTWEAWIKPDHPDTWPAGLSNSVFVLGNGGGMSGGTTNTNWYFRIFRSGNIGTSGRLINPPQQFTAITAGSGVSVKFDEWNHIAARLARNSTGSFRWDFFLNGDMFFSGSLSPIGQVMQPWGLNRAGQYTDNNDQYYFPGAIGEVRLWNVARSDLQIKLRYRERLTGNETGLVAYWPLDDGWQETRQYNPLDQGTFWGKLRARNPYYGQRPLRVWSGYIADPTDISTFDFDNAQRRDYLIDKIEGPDPSGRVRVIGKDPLKAADDDRALAPAPSRGRLFDDIDDQPDAVITLVPAGIGNEEYPASGEVAINSEIAEFTRVGDAMTLTARGVRGTEAGAHGEGDSVQLCLHIGPTTVDQIDRMLLVDYANVPAEFIPDAAWQEEINNYIPATYEAFIAEPVGVRELLKEIGSQAPHQLFWDERVNLIRLQAVKEPDVSAPTFNERQHFQEGTFTVSDDPKRRVSLVVVNFSVINPLESDEPKNYRQSYVRGDLERERQFGGRQIRQINSRWINQTGRAEAERLAAIVGRRWAVIPRVVEFTMQPKDSALWTGDTFYVEHSLIQSATGAIQRVPFQVVSVEEAEIGFRYRAVQYTFDPRGPDDPPDNEYLHIIGEDTFNVNLRALQDEKYPGAPLDPEIPVRLRVETNATLGSTGASLPSLVIGTWPADIEIIVEVAEGGAIKGRGGVGGRGQTPFLTSTAFMLNYMRGGAGGDAIRTDYPFTLVNAGVVAGGGGGGGGAGGGVVTQYPPVGGGGGAGFGPGNGGIISAPPPNGFVGSPGTPEEGGAGGSNQGVVVGGRGGDLGENGSPATGPAQPNLVYAGGGLAGNAIDSVNGAGLVTIINTGQIIGPVVN